MVEHLTVLIQQAGSTQVARRLQNASGPKCAQGWSSNADFFTLDGECRYFMLYFLIMYGITLLLAIVNLVLFGKYTNRKGIKLSGEHSIPNLIAASCMVGVVLMPMRLYDTQGSVVWGFGPPSAIAVLQWLAWILYVCIILMMGLKMLPHLKNMYATTNTQHCCFSLLRIVIVTMCASVIVLASVGTIAPWTSFCSQETLARTMIGGAIFIMLVITCIFATILRGFHRLYRLELLHWGEQFPEQRAIISQSEVVTRRWLMLLLLWMVATLLVNILALALPVLLLNYGYVVPLLHLPVSVFSIIYLHSHTRDSTKVKKRHPVSLLTRDSTSIKENANVFQVLGAVVRRHAMTTRGDADERKVGMTEGHFNNNSRRRGKGGE